MRPPGVVAIVAPAQADPLGDAAWAHALGRLARHAQVHRVQAAVWLRDHHLDRGGWHDVLSRWSWLRRLELPLGVSAPPLPPSPASWAQWQQLGVDWLHVSERHAAAWLAAPPQLPWSKACHDAAGADAALAAGAAWVTLSPVAATPSKPDATPIGWDGLTAVCRRFPQRVVALGGIDALNAAQAQQAGAVGIAVQRAWQTDPAALVAAWASPRA